MRNKLKNQSNGTKPKYLLTQVRQWAKTRIDSGQEPPWAWYQYMKLIEATDAILNGMATTKTKENLRLVAMHRGTDLQQEGSTSESDELPRHHADGPVKLPM